jgi:hypothetical protein
MTDFNCEFCNGIFKSRQYLNKHKEKTKACIEIQIKKLGKPFSQIEKEKIAAEGSKTPEKEAEKKIVEENTSDDESDVDENEEIPLSSSEDESSSSESDNEPYKVEELSTVKEVFDNIEKYQKTNPARLNNLFKKKSTTVKTEIITDDQPPEVHKRKIEEYLPSKSPAVDVKFSGDNQDLKKEISKVIEDKFSHLETKVMSSVSKLETKMNSMLDIIGKLEESNEKRMKSIEKVGIKDIERVIDEKLHDMFYITKKMIAEVDSKNELLDIFRENMEDIVDKHYELYKKFKYVKEDIEDMVYDKGSKSGSRRR